ncbi:MAG: proton-conducting membrane transporter, partial [Lachnospiraceae bacterium]|nr:proton-conducting membrane transporter [Candidatus Equihabitans merdae]
SQLSYIMFGLACLSPVAMTGALLHALFHAAIKTTLFMCAGAIILNTGKHRVSEMRGVGRLMPKTIWCWTLGALGLIGIPPTSGFISKWYLATGALSTDIGIFSYLGPIILLVSALLTAGYLLPITMRGFFPGEEFEGVRGEKEAPVKMLIPLVIMAAAVVLMGVLPNPFINYLSCICSGLM